MPRLTFSAPLAASGIAAPIQGNWGTVTKLPWQFQYLPWPAEITLCARATTANVVMTFVAGNATLVQEQTVPAGGTAGQTPTVFNAPIMTEYGAQGDFLTWTFRETSGAVATVDGWIDVQPMMG